MAAYTPKIFQPGESKRKEPLVMKEDTIWYQQSSHLRKDRNCHNSFHQTGRNNYNSNHRYNQRENFEPGYAWQKPTGYTWKYSATPWNVNAQEHQFENYASEQSYKPIKLRATTQVTYPDIDYQKIYIGNVGLGVWQIFNKDQIDVLMSKLQKVAGSATNPKYNYLNCTISLSVVSAESEVAYKNLKQCVKQSRKKLHQMSTITVSLYRRNNIIRVLPGLVVADLFLPNEEFNLKLPVTEIAEEIKEKYLQDVQISLNRSTEHTYLKFNSKQQIEQFDEYLKVNPISDADHLVPVIAPDPSVSVICFALPRRYKKIEVLQALQKFDGIVILKRKFAEDCIEHYVYFKNKECMKAFGKGYSSWAQQLGVESIYRKWIKEEITPFQLSRNLIQSGIRKIKYELDEIFSRWNSCSIELQQDHGHICPGPEPPSYEVLCKIYNLWSPDIMTIPDVIVQMFIEGSFKFNIYGTSLSLADWSRELEVHLKLSRKQRVLYVWGTLQQRVYAIELIEESIRQEMSQIVYRQVRYTAKHDIEKLKIDFVNRNIAVLADDTDMYKLYLRGDNEVLKSAAKHLDVHIADPLDICCEICQFPMEYDTIQLYSCGHQYHKQCFLDQLLAQVQNKPALLPIKWAKCNELTVYEDWIQVTSRQQIQEMYKKSLELFVTGSSKYRHCENPYCGAIYETDRYNKDNCDKFKCPACEREYCFLCEKVITDRHHEAECQMRQMLRTDQETQEWVNQHTIRCPNCHFAVEKNGGCNHMKCPRCRRDFCALCQQFVNHVSYMDHYTDVNSPCFHKFLTVQPVPSIEQEEPHPMWSNSATNSNDDSHKGIRDLAENIRCFH